MRVLLTQQGFVCLALMGLLILTGLAMLIAPSDKKPIGKSFLKRLGLTAYTIIGFALTTFSTVVAIYIGLDIAMVDLLHSQPSVMANTVIAVLYTVAAAATFCWAVILVRNSVDRGRWLLASQPLIMSFILGFIASTMWLFTDAFGRDRIADAFAQVLAAMCFVSVIVVAEFAIVVARPFAIRKVEKEPGG